MSIVILSDKGYNAWEAGVNRWALNMAETLIREYNARFTRHGFEYDQSSEVMKYSMMKVWHILSGSGIFLDFKVKKKKDKCYVVISMSEQAAEYIDAPDEDEDDA